MVVDAFVDAGRVHFGRGLGNNCFCMWCFGLGYIKVLGYEHDNITSSQVKK